MTTGIWIPWCADAARLTGYPVVEVAGWRTNGTGGVGGGMRAVEGVVLHHTAGPKVGEMPSLGVIRDGRAGLDGPLSHFGLGRSGTVYVTAAGACNHAGASEWLGFRDLNSRFVGIEAEDDGDGTWTAEQLDCYPRLVAACLHYMRRDASRAAGHREVATPSGRKPDPTGIDMPAMRRRVAELLVDPTRLIPRAAAAATHRTEDPLMALSDADQKLLVEAARSVLFGIGGVRPAGPLALAVNAVGNTLDAVRTELGGLIDREPSPAPGAAPVLTDADHDAIARRVLALLTEHPLVPKG